MEYSIQALSELAKVSTRTLRYYDEIGLLKAKGMHVSGYRIYSEEAIDRLQLILFYKELGVKLSKIKAIIDNSEFDALDALKDHHQNLVGERNRLNQLILTVEETIHTKEGGGMMNNKDKFKGFKQELINKNEETYGDEIREKYGEEKVNASNKKFMNMSEQDYETFMSLGEQINIKLAEAFQRNDVEGGVAKELVTEEEYNEKRKYYWTTSSKGY